MHTILPLAHITSTDTGWGLGLLIAGIALGVLGTLVALRFARR